MGTMRSSGRLWLVVGFLAAAAGGGLLVTRPRQSDPAAATATEPQASDFAKDRAAKERPVPFDAQRAYGYLQQICRLGPRPSGSEGMARQQEMLKDHFRAHGATVELQRFSAKQRSRKEPIPMANLIARWHPERQRRVLLCAHYDTRPLADQEPDPRDWHKPFLGANDGASGPALFMELAHHLRALPLHVGVDFVLFDGEECIYDPRPSDQGGDLYFFGSEHFAREYTRQRTGPAGERQAPRYVKAVLVDMVAGKQARFYWEQYSFAHAARLCEEIWNIAAAEGITRFVPQVKHAVLDDHLPLLRAGIPTIDIIDFDYVHWHRLSDSPENCSGETLADVGKVLSIWLQRCR
jgi:hypothetical protein